MSTLDTTELARLLRDATAEVTAPPGFDTEVIRGGRRRRFRRRTTVAGTLALVVATGAVTATLPWHHDAPAAGALVSAAHNPMLTTKTRGELRTDTAYLQAAEDAFTYGMARSPNGDQRLVDTPHVYWADETPAGRVAVVIQRRAAERGTAKQANGTYLDLSTLEPTVIGLVVGDKPRLVTAMLGEPHGLADGFTFLFGDHDRYGLVFAELSTLWYSPEWVIGQDGKGARQWTEVPKVDDGVGFFTLPPSVDSRDTRVILGLGPERMAADKLIPINRASLYNEGYDRQRNPIAKRSTNLPADAPIRAVGSTSPPLQDSVVSLQDALVRAGYADPLGPRAEAGFQFIADLPGITSVVALEFTPTFGGSRLYVALRNYDGGVTQWVYISRLTGVDRRIPLSARLQHGIGTLVIAVDKSLRYRTSADAPWIDAGSQVAVLPPSARYCEYRGATGLPEVTALP
ncbi:hypothetical protein V5P93_006174 [Actinokineospora auranticolor]|uniref:Uncharacterized protein n=1 Tax=Actinokineospora auranticolor TaxID=155976 RepID=A0A2S6GHY5_9PSEU|nr:hypothetical protein [Actinokineospora auranticolor]PPK64771.1 hypothetical protein CLV40_1179 [Actinokineospora auranticolor]